MPSILRSEAIQQTVAIQAVLDQLDPGAMARLRVDALTTLGAWPGLRVDVVPEVSAGECSIGGIYRPANGAEPAILVVAMSGSHRRRQFSVLHEFAHHLQRTTMDLMMLLATSPDARALEEAACEVFAARILLPDDLVDQVIDQRGPTAAAVAELYARSGASRAACCVRAAERLQSPGAVYLVDASGTVNFSAGRGLPPPARNSDQSDTPLIAAAMRTGGRARTSTRIAYRTGSMSEELYGDCAAVDGWLVAVVVRDRPAWMDFALPRPGSGHWVGATWWTCTYCDVGFQVSTTARCNTCNEPRCPAGHCQCTQASERRCDDCGMVKHRNQFQNPTSSICVDCS